MQIIDRRLTLAASLLLMVVSPLPAQDKPLEVPVLPDTYGSVVIGDLPGLLDRAGELANKVMPSMDKRMLRQQFGAMAGDPELKGLPAGSGLAVIIPRSGLPFAFLEVSPEKLADYEKLMKSRGLSSVAQVEGILVGAANAGSLDAAKRFAQQVKSQVLQDQGQPALMGSIKLAELLKQYEPQLEGAMKSMAGQMNQATTVTAQLRSAEVIMRVYYALGKKVELFQMSFAPTFDGLKMDYEVKPVGGISAAGATPAPGVSGPAMLKLVPGEGGIRAEWTFDPQWLAGPMMKTVADAMRESGVPAENTAELGKWMQSSADMMAGGMAMNIGSQLENPMAGAYAMSVSDETAALNFLKEMPGKMETTGLVAFYKSMGMPMTLNFTENTKDYQGTPIHQLTMKLDFSDYPVQDRERMEKLIGNVVYDVAVVEKVLLYAVVPEKIEPLIDAVRAGSHPAAKPLVSKSNLPANGSYYLDYDLGAVMNLASASMGGKQVDHLRKFTEKLAGAPPVQIGGSRDADKYRMTILVPADTMKAFAGRSDQPAASATSAEDDTTTTPE